MSWVQPRSDSSVCAPAPLPTAACSVACRLFPSALALMSKTEGWGNPRQWRVLLTVQRVKPGGRWEHTRHFDTAFALPQAVPGWSPWCGCGSGEDAGDEGPCSICAGRLCNLCGSARPHSQTGESGPGGGWHYLQGRALSMGTCGQQQR